MAATNRPTMTIECDFVNDPTSLTETWTNITAYCRAPGDGAQLLSTQRGRDYELARVSTGTFSLILDNTDGRFDPTNAASPYVTGTGNPGGVAGLVTAGRRIRIRATWLAVTYDLFRGYVDEWPQSWSAAGFYGSANTAGTDGFAALALVDLPAFVVFETLKDLPILLDRCDDASGSVTAGNSSTVNQPLSAIVAGSTAAASDSFAFGSDAGSRNLIGDSSSSLAFSTQSWNGSVNATGYALRTADLGVGPLLLLGGFTHECWFKTTNNTQNAFGTLFFQVDATAFTVSATQIQCYLSEPSPGILNPVVFYQNAAATQVAFVSSGTNVGDGNWHHLVCTLAADNKTPRMILDGVDQTAGVGATVSPAGSAITWNASYLNEWGGAPRPSDPTGSFGNAAGYFDGSIKNLTLYNTVLSLARAQAHFSAGQGFPGDSTATRQGRILDAAAWPAALRNLSTGDSTHGGQATDTSKALEAAQTVSDTEGGVLFASGDGKITQTARSARYNLTAAAAFGEQAAELHYLGDITVALDSREIFNDVTVSRLGGITVRAQDTASQARYFPRTYQVPSTANSDLDAVYLAQWLLARYKTPIARIPTLTLDPFTQPLLWPKVLGYDIGTMVTISRRPGGAARNISADFFIERVSHAVTGQSWTTSWMLSPASVAKVFQLDSATYGHLAGVPSALTATITAGATTVSLTATATDNYSTTDVPYFLDIESERVTVTAMAAIAAGAQVATITRAANGTVAAAHLAGVTANVVSYPLAY